MKLKFIIMKIKKVTIPFLFKNRYDIKTLQTLAIVGLKEFP